MSVFHLFNVMLDSEQKVMATVRWNIGDRLSAPARSGDNLEQILQIWGIVSHGRFTITQRLSNLNFLCRSHVKRKQTLAIPHWLRIATKLLGVTFSSMSCAQRASLVLDTTNIFSDTPGRDLGFREHSGGVSGRPTEGAGIGHDWRGRPRRCGACGVEIQA